MKELTKRNDMLLEEQILLDKKPQTRGEEFELLMHRISLSKLELEDDIYDKSDISQYFKGKTIFLTGGAGFLGQLYIEKCLRIGAKRIYCLMRPKKGQTPDQRIRQILDEPVYQRLREKDEHFQDRVSVINGDLNQEMAGMNDLDIQLLCEEVDVVIHAAADVRFNIPLLDLVQSNVRRTRDILEIAKKMKNLKVFAYVSTAYSHCPRDIIEEKFYEPPMDPKFWLKMLDRCKTPAEKEIIDIIEPHIMEPWPNTYTYTKALTESLVKRYSCHFPTIVIRPSIIVSTYQDPVPGWTNNITGINERLGRDSITIRKHEVLHSMKCVYYPVITFTHYEWQDTLATIFLQALPCFFMDFFNTEKIRLLAVCRKIKSTKNVIQFFMSKRIFSDSTNVTREIYDRMSDVDKKLFPSDSRNFEWTKFHYAYYAGMRVYVLNDPLESFFKSKVKLRILKYIHYTLKYSFVSTLVF